MKPMPEQLTELIVQCRKIKTTHTGRSARRQLSGVLQRAAQQMLLPLPDATRQLRRRMLETLVGGRPVWDRNGEYGNPTEDATIVWPKDVVTVVAVIDEQGRVLPSPGTSPEQVKEIEDYLKGASDVQGDEDP